MRNTSTLSLWDRGFISVFVIAVTAVLLSINARFDNRDEALLRGRDVMYIWQDSKMIVDGENPYSRIAGQSMEKNKKYTFYLPAFLVGTAATIAAGLDTFPEWMRAWRWGALFFHLGVGLTLLWACVRYGFVIGGMVAAGIWLFGRWSLLLWSSGQVDNVAILPFVLSLALVQTHFRTACLLFGVSLAVKQMAVLAAPVYLIYAWHRGSFDRMRSVVQALFYISAVPLVLSIPFILWDAESFFRMLLFPLTRGNVGGRTFAEHFGSTGIAGKLPLVLLLLGTYWLMATRRVQVAGAALLIMVISVSFSAAFFTRYLCWVIPLIPLCALELRAMGRVGDREVPSSGSIVEAQRLFGHAKLPPQSVAG